MALKMVGYTIKSPNYLINRSMWWDDFRYKEGAKIQCGKKHFAVLTTEENPAKHIKAKVVADILIVHRR